MTFAQLALICLVALLGPALQVNRWAHLPAIVGELLIGVLLGETGLRLLDATDPTFGLFGQIGFALVMLVAGSRVPVRDDHLRGGLRVGLLRAVLVGAVAVPVGWAIAAAFGTGHGILYAVLLASSSASLIMPALADAPLTAPAIVEMLPQVAAADAVSIILLPLAIDPSNVGRAAVGAAVVLLAAWLVFLFLRWSERSGRRKALHRVSEEHGLAVELRTSLVILFALAALATAAHVSILLAGFSFGLALAAIGEPRRLSKQLFALTEGFFGPIFFVWLGASLNLRDLAVHPAALVLSPVLGLAAAVVHLAGVVTRQPWPVATVTCAQLGVPIAAATLGGSLGLLHPGEDTALLLGAMVTVAVTSLLAGRLLAIARAVST